MSNLRLDIDSVWVALVNMRQYLTDLNQTNQEYVCLVWEKKIEQWVFYSEKLVSVETHCILIPLVNKRSLFIDRLCDTKYTVSNPSYHEGGQSFWLTNHTLDDLSAIEMYLTFILEEFQARKDGRCFVLEHRRLDDHANQLEVMHFHRLRSLFEGVALNWRDALLGQEYGIDYVAGEPPVKVVLDPHGDLADSIDEIEMFQDGVPVYFIVSSKQAERKIAEVMPVGTDVFLLEQNDSDLKKLLAAKGVNSLLVEGENLL